MLVMAASPSYPFSGTQADGSVNYGVTLYDLRIITTGEPSWQRVTMTWATLTGCEQPGCRVSKAQGYDIGDGSAGRFALVASLNFYNGDMPVKLLVTIGMNDHCVTHSTYNVRERFDEVVGSVYSGWDESSLFVEWIQYGKS